jgi:hypothetical protein
LHWFAKLRGMPIEVVAIALAPSLVVFGLGCTLAAYRTVRAGLRRPTRVRQAGRAG